MRGATLQHTVPVETKPRLKGHAGEPGRPAGSRQGYKEVMVDGETVFLLHASPCVKQKGKRECCLGCTEPVCHEDEMTKKYSQYYQ